MFVLYSELHQFHVNNTDPVEKSLQHYFHQLSFWQKGMRYPENISLIDHAPMRVDVTKLNSDKAHVIRGLSSSFIKR